MSFGTWTFTDDVDDELDVNGGYVLAQLTHHLSAPRVELRNDPASHLHGVIFRRASRVVRGSQRLIFRESAEQLRPGLPAFPPILATGHLNIQSDHFQRRIQINCNADFSSNATRYMRQQGQRQRPAPRHLQPFADVFRLDFPVEVNGEWSLDGEDNWLPTSANGRVMWTQEKAIGAVTELADKLKQRITSELRSAARNAQIADPTAFPSSGLSADAVGQLRQLETYFEFFHEEPVRFVESVESVARSYANRVYVRRYDVETADQSLSIRLELRAGIQLRVYAKTNRRVRFELQHNLPEMNGPLRGLQPFTSRAEQRHVLTMLRDHATVEVNQFLEFLNEQPIHPAQQHSPLMLVIRICESADDSALARGLLEQLCVNRRVVLSETSPLRHVIRRLADHHLREPVLVNRRRTPVYRLTRSWRHAISVLAREGHLTRLAELPVRRARIHGENAEGPS